MGGIMIQITDELHAEFKKKLIDMGQSQKSFWASVVADIASGNQPFIIPPDFVKMCGGNFESRQKLLSWIQIERERRERAAGKY